MKIPADDGGADFERADQYFFDESLRRHSRERGVEAQANQPVHAQRLDRRRFGREQRQAEDDRAADEMIGGMRLEGQYGARRSAFRRERLAVRAMTARWPRCTPSKLPIA